MPVSHCLDLTEFYQGKPVDCSHAHFIAEFISETDQVVKRAYFGSSFCSRYFLNLSPTLLGEVFGALASQGILVTLVVPIFTQGDLAQGKERIESILQQHSDAVDELTVNDFGMLRHFANTGVTLNLGRLFNRDLRDIRYEDEYERTSEPSLLKGEVEALKDEYGIRGVELDLSHRRIDCSAAPGNLTLAFYTPYSYISTAQICPYASIGLPPEAKFRPNQVCSLRCQHSRRVVAGLRFKEFVTAGRTTYFLSDKAEVLNIDNYRLVHSLLIRKAL